MSTNLEFLSGGGTDADAAFISALLLWQALDWTDLVMNPLSLLYLIISSHIFLILFYRTNNMKLSIIATLVASAAAFAPASQGPQTTALNAQMNRQAFLAAAGASLVAASPLVANAGTMGQEQVTDPTEV